MISNPQRDTILACYELHKSIMKVCEITKYNYRTVRKYVIAAGYEIKHNRVKEPVKLEFKDGLIIEADSIMLAARELNKMDQEKKRMLLRRDETFEEGCKFKPLSTSSYRKHITSALKGQPLKQFEWEVTRLYGNKEKK